MVQKPNDLTDADQMIIESLQLDGRRPYAEIAAELGMAPSTVQQRANRLIKRGVMKIKAVTDPTVMGVPIIATVALKVDGETMRDVADVISKFKDVSYLVICAGSWDIQLEIACRDNDHLLNTISKISKVSGVKSVETFIYLKIVKNSYQWGV
ncbi:MAG: Lrp/AsnC family transcriptional regulator for asnA, asnC and gidA [Cellvibrionaceae bacterium]|jgi:Lrp/AsnC family transcriptional regulator for asnA, asnC and gidA